MALMRVRYKGLSDVRTMSKKALNDAGVGISEQLKWERKNGWSVYVDGLSDRLEEVLRAEGTFRIEEVNEETRQTVKVVTDGQPLDDTGAVVKDATTGQKSTKKS